MRFTRDSLLSRFVQRQDGAVALMFGLVGLVLLMLVGGAIDYSRAANERTRLQSAIDATGLALVHLPSDTSAAVISQQALAFFSSVYKPSPGFSTPRLTATQMANGIKLEAVNDVPLSVLALTGTNSWPVGVSSQTVYGKNKIEIALVLDNSGSMAIDGKITALKNAVDNLITQLSSLVVNPGDVKLSLVPFNTQVNIGTGYASSSALRFDVDVSNPHIRNYIKNFGISRYAPIPANWPGCVSDRDDDYHDYDTKGDAPTTAKESKYVAAYCHYYVGGYPVAGQQITAMKALTTDLDSVRAASNSMIPTGATNITIGLVTGLATLRADTPFGAQSATDTFTNKFVIVFTDGHNTQNRFKGNGFDKNAESPQVDARFSKACDNARSSARAVIFTVGIGDGANDLLRSCATDPAAYYFPISSASQIGAAFEAILGQITKIRTSR